MTVTQIKAVIKLTQALAEAVRKSKEIPSGHLYAAVMDKVNLQNYNWVMDRLVGAGLVKLKGDLVVWTGPEGWKPS